MRMIFSCRLIWVAIFAFIVSCDEIPFDDDQYGDICNVISIKGESTSPSVTPITTTIAYDQYDWITDFERSMENSISSKMVVTYNDNMAFADFYINNQYFGSAEAVLNEYGNLLNCIYSDSLNTDIAELNFFYDSNNQLIKVEGTDYLNGVSGTWLIEWTNGNPTRITDASGVSIKIQYFAGLKSSFKWGKGNVALLINGIGDIHIYSEDLMQVYDVDGISPLGEPIYLEYEFDSDDKVREIYYSSKSNGIFGTNFIDYECYDK